MRKILSNHHIVLGFGFGFLFLVAGISGIAIIILAQDLQKDIEALSDNYSESTRLIGQIQIDVNLMRVLVRDGVYSRSAEEKEGLRESMDSIALYVSKSFEKYKPLALLPEEKRQFDNYSKLFHEYLVDVEEIMSVDSMGENSRAVDLLQRKIPPFRPDFNEISKNLVEANEAASVVTRANIKAREKQFLYIGFIIIFSMLVVGGVVYYFISRNFLQYIQSIKESEVERENLLTLLMDRQERIEQLVLDISSIEEEQRKRFSQELHDAIGHGLTTAILNIDSARSELPPGQTQLANFLQNALDCTKETLAETKRISYELRPHLLDDFGLSRALKQLFSDFEKRSGIKTMIELSDDLERFQPNREISLFRVAQEVLTNIERHSGAHCVMMQLLKRDDGILAMSISDDGKGFDRQQVDQSEKSHLGLRNIVERIELIGGMVIIDSTQGRGTEINIEVPIVELKRKV